jgi:hypothetical protein
METETKQRQFAASGDYSSVTNCRGKNSGNILTDNWYFLLYLILLLVNYTISRGSPGALQRKRGWEVLS